MTKPEKRHVSRRDILILAGILLVGVIGAMYIRAGSGEEQGLYARVFFMGEQVLLINLATDTSFTLAEAMSLDPQGLPSVYFEVQGGALSFVKSDCPDLLCVFMGPQSLVGGFAACLPNRLLFHIEEAEYSLFTAAFFDFFDTVIFLRLFSNSQDEFDAKSEAIYNELKRLHILFDIFNEYEGINNIATINRHAGIEPVTACEALLSLIEEGLKAYRHSDGAVNIAMGPILRLWHDFLTGSANSPPSIEALEAAEQLSNINDVIIADNQVFLARFGMSLDVGALAKGVALERAVAVAEDFDVISGIISIGGDMALIGRPLDGRASWTVGIENPEGGIFGTKRLDSTSVASSGNYQRFVMYNENRYHHIIDPFTLKPTGQFSSLTIVHPSPMVAEFLSTAAFVMPFEDGIQLVTAMGAEALWILPDGSYKHTNGFAFVRVE